MSKPPENLRKNAEQDAKPDGGTRKKAGPPQPLPKEIGGRDGPEPTRYGDWEKNGRCIDF